MIASILIFAFATIIAASCLVDCMGRTPSLEVSKLATAWRYNPTESKNFVAFFTLFALMTTLFGLTSGWPAIIPGVLCLLPVTAALDQYRDAHGLTWEPTLRDRAIAAYNYDLNEAVSIASTFFGITIVVAAVCMVCVPYGLILSIFLALPISVAIDLDRATQLAPSLLRSY